MAKKLSFINADAIALTRANEIRFVTLATTMLRKDINDNLRKAHKSLESIQVEIEKTQANEEGLAEDKVAKAVAELEEKYAIIEKQKTVLEDKRTHLSKYLRVKLWGDKKAGVEGLYNNLLVDGDGKTMYGYYQDFHTDYKVEKYRDGIKRLCGETFGVKGGKNALYMSLINRLEHACGIKATGGSAYCKGQETKTLAEREFTELFFRTLHEYLVKNSGGKVANYTSEYYDYKVEWDEGNHVVELGLVER